MSTGGGEMKDRGRQGRKEGERESLMQGNKVMCDRGDAKSTILVKTYREKVRKRERERGGKREREGEENWHGRRGLLSSVAVCGA